MSEWKDYELKAREFILCSSEEFLALDRNHFGLFTTLSHIARLGIQSSPTSFFIDPEFKGHITFELYNFSPNSIKLRRNMPIGKIIVAQCDTQVSTETTSPSTTHFYYGSKNHLRSPFYEEFSKPQES